MEEKVLMEAKGVNGQLQLLETKIRISRKGLMAFTSHGLKGEKEILIKSISSIQFKKTSLLTNGYIQFSFIGGQEIKGGIRDATKDENTIMFNPKQQPNFIKIKEAIEEKMLSLEKGESKTSDLEQLEKLAELKAKGIITEEEFEAKKKQILGV